MPAVESRCWNCFFLWSNQPICHVGNAADASPGSCSDACLHPAPSLPPPSSLPALRVDSGIDMTHKEAYLSDAEFEKVRSCMAPPLAAPSAATP